jgi:hypothetical protein
MTNLDNRGSLFASDLSVCRASVRSQRQSKNVLEKLRLMALCPR